MRRSNLGNGRRRPSCARTSILPPLCAGPILTWANASGGHLRGHEPGQMFDLGVGAGGLHRGVGGLEGGWHRVRQVHHADQHLGRGGPRARGLDVEKIPALFKFFQRSTSLNLRTHEKNMIGSMSVTTIMQYKNRISLEIEHRLRIS